MDSTLPPLPEPNSYCTYKDAHEYDVFDADQMLAYGAECRRLALDECAALCSGQIPPGCSTSLVAVSRNQGIRACYDAIRALSSQGQQQEGGAT